MNINSIIEKMTEHPVLHKPDAETLRSLVEKNGVDYVSKLIQLREDKITAEKSDPYRHGYEPFHWEEADKLLKEKDELLILGVDIVTGKHIAVS